MEIQHPERNPVVPRLTPLDQRINGRVRPALLVLACAVGVVMLIVCANLSNLQLARLGARQKELAMRAALGAGRLRLLRQMLTESIALSCCGAVLGLSSRDRRHTGGGASERLQSSLAEQRAHRRKRAGLHRFSRRFLPASCLACCLRCKPRIEPCRMR